MSGRTPAENVLVRRARGLVGELLTAREQIRSRDSESIHDTRVAARRLRSMFTTFDRFFDAAGTRDVREELVWFGCQLGVARDAEVLRDLIGAAGPHLPDSGELQARLALITDETEHDARIAAERLDGALSSERYERLSDELRAFARKPPLSCREELRPRALRKALRRRVLRCDELVDHAHRLAGEERSLALHEVRKVAKHVRYGAETLAPLAPNQAKTLARAFADVQSVLGDHHDAYLAREFSLAQLKRATEEPSLAFVCGVLFRHESDEVQKGEVAFEVVWAAAAADEVRRLVD